MAEDHRPDRGARSPAVADEERFARVERKLAALLAEQSALAGRVDVIEDHDHDGSPPSDRDITASLRTIVDFVGTATKASNDVQDHLVTIDHSLRGLASRIAENTSAVTAESPLAAPLGQVCADVEALAAQLAPLATSVPAALLELTNRTPLTRGDVDRSVTDALASLEGRTQHIDIEVRAIGSRLSALYEDMTRSLKNQEDELGRLLANLRAPVELAEFEHAVNQLVTPLADALHTVGRSVEETNRHYRQAALRAGEHPEAASGSGDGSPPAETDPSVPADR
jgi:hypothetical protein